MLRRCSRFACVALSASIGLGLALPFEAHAGDVNESIDEAFREGRIDAGDRLIYRAMAVRAPERLPGGWRAMSTDGARHCGSGALFEAVAAQKLLSLDQRAVLDDLLAPPQALPFAVESSSPFPVRVSYASEDQAAYAERILADVETSFEKEVEEWGFWPPLVEPGQPFFEVYVEDTGPGSAAFTAPYLANPDTPHEDAFAYIVVDPGLSDDFLDITVAHEFNHACQAAMDMTEPAAFFESTSTYVESLVFPAGAFATVEMFPLFQSKPYLPIEYAKAGPSDGYEYGASLWLFFLAHVYGEDDPRFVRALWEGSVQTGPINEPDNRDVLDQMLADRGGMAGAVEAFGRYRFFVGAYGDDAHLPSASKWKGAEVAIAATYGEAQLPIEGKTPDPDTRPRPGGCNYVTVTPGGGEDLPLRFTFDGDPELPWNVSVLELSADAGASEATMTIDDEAHGTLAVDPTGLDLLAMVVCQGMPDNYDLDAKYWPSGDYRYGISYDVAPPTVARVTPPEVPRGAHGFAATIEGHGFYDGEELAVELSGSKAAVTDLVFVSPEEVRITLAVAPDAELGPRDVTVVNPGGAEAKASGAITIVEAATTPAPVPGAETREPSSAGDGCSVGAPSEPRESGWTPWMLLGAVGAWPRRSRRSRTRRMGACAIAFAILLVSGGVAWAGPAFDGFVDSTKYPIRVHYTAAAGAGVADEALGYAETAWGALFVDMGFESPRTIDDDGNPIPGLWLYLDPAATNIANAIGDDPTTPRTDCLTNVLIATTSPSGLLKFLVVSEVAQAALLATDCGESVFAWKSSAIALSTLIDPDDSLFTDTILPTFQEFPHAGLDCTFPSNQKMFWYHYGAALFWRFLEDAYGESDGKLVASLWKAAEQDGTVLSTATGLAALDVPNEPDVLDVVSRMTGGLAFDDVLAEFARWRYFVGAHDDGAHFHVKSPWFGSEVAIDTSLAMAELPLTGAAPEQAVAGYGSSYVELSLDGVSETTGIQVRFQGDPAVRWNVDALLVRGDHTAEIVALDVDEAAKGEVVLDGLGGFDHVAFIATNLSDPGHDADSPNCKALTSYAYDLEPVDLATPPSVSGVDPSLLAPGKSYDVWLTGSDFAEGLSVSFGDGVAVAKVDVVDATSAAVSIAVDATAKEGARDLVVTNPNGKSATLEAAVTIQAEAAKKAAKPSTPDEVEGGGCQMAGRSAIATSLLPLFALLGAAAARRRRNRASAPR